MSGRAFHLLCRPSRCDACVLRRTCANGIAARHRLRLHRRHDRPIPSSPASRAFGRLSQRQTCCFALVDARKNDCPDLAEVLDTLEEMVSTAEIYRLLSRVIRDRPKMKRSAFQEGKAERP